MTDIEKRAHDVAVAFVTCYQQKKYTSNDAELMTPLEFADDYQDAYNKILNLLKDENQ